MSRARMFVGQLLQDLQYAGRVVAKQPGTTAIIVLSLALGIGANTVVFSLVNGILLRALPYSDPEGLVMLWFTPPGHPEQNQLSNAGICMDLPDRDSFYEHAGCYIAVGGNVADPSDSQTTGPEWLPGEMLSYSAVEAVGTKPLMGRWFTKDEDHADAERVMLISYDLWQRRFGGTQDILGKRLRVADFGGNDTPSTIIGVMPQGFVFANNNSSYFVPLRPTGRLRRSPVRNRWVVARLKPGVTLAQAQEGANLLAAGFAKDSPLNKDWGIKVQPLVESLVGDLKAPFQVLQGTAALVLLIACANVGGLLLAQGAARQRELAVRAALGSGRGRIVRQLLTESVVLSGIGAAVSVAAVAYGMQGLVHWLPAWIPRLNEVGVDSRVLVFTFVVAVATAVLFGVLPALQASRLDLATAFKAGDRAATTSPGRLRLRGAFLVLQISASLVLLTGAGLLINTLLRLHSVDVGFDPGNLTTFSMTFSGREFFGATGKVTPSGSTEMELSPRVYATTTRLRDRIAAVPGVDDVTSIGSTTPLGGTRMYNFTIEGRQPPTSERDALSARWYTLTSGYFRVLHAPPLRGREFTDFDSASSPPVALINETMARRYWPGENPVGRYITVQFFNDTPRQIVGIVPDIRTQLRELEPEPQMYVPYAQLPQFQEGRTAFGLETMTFVIRSRANTATWLPMVRAEAKTIDPAHAISEVEPLDEFATRQTQGFRQYVILLGVFGLIALTLSAVGIYGVMSHSVTRQTSEIGIRVALGARGTHVLTRVLGQGLVVIGLGLVIGLALSLGLSRIVSSVLWGVSPTDPLTFGIVVATLVVVAGLACVLPARRALKVDPLVAMRQE